ncbi:hypothetical protein BS50DRAFT_602194 [Corynespora cassiicola Philippines]|uniref:Uncharacterized protein n=1 Tax=Corynespora cassiicola Philippines TaxID=1448308 RepID=A0A2T2NGI2_CORCC|nr:hypothetical protein BS50DRAFT_602194 [Corynespora cassiicola Philippines]
MTNSLQRSRFAPKTPAQEREISQEQKTKADKARAMRLMARLRWKSELLAASYVRAAHILQPNRMQPSPFLFVESGVGSKEAETMFKVDFFEFYTLLERYIVLCLEIMGVYISGATSTRTNVNALRLITNPEYARRRPEASHAFHQNILDAIDEETNPLHTSFGNQDTRVQLGLAKDFRNAWKDADERATATNNSEEANGRVNVKLLELQLGPMLRTLLDAAKHALGVVTGQDQSNNTNGSADDIFDSMDTDYPLEYMDDAMDLD